MTVRVHDHPAVDVARRPAGRLDERPGRPEEPLLVGVEDRHQRHLGQVEPLAEQVDARPARRTRRAAGRAGSPPARGCRCRSAGSARGRPAPGSTAVRSSAIRLVSVVTSTRSLRAARSRISASRSSTWPFTGRISIGGSIRPVGRMICSTTTPPAALQLEGPGRGRDEDHLVGPRLPLLEVQRAVVERRRQAEAVARPGPPCATGRRGTSRGSAAPSGGSRPRTRGVGREVVEQRRRRLARRPAGQVPGVVLDAVAVADLADHLEVEHRPLVQALRLEQLALRLQLRRGARPARP